MRLTKLRVNVGVLVIVASTLFSCRSSEPPIPTKKSPINGCYISCPKGYSPYRHQHLCNGGVRQFQDIIIIGEDKVSGSPEESRWFTTEGTYRKIDVEIGSCRSVIATIIQAREPSERGIHPGEDSQGNPVP